MLKIKQNSNLEKIGKFLRKDINNYRDKDKNGKRT